MTKEQMAKCFREGADVAKQLGGAACDLGKKGFNAAREKLKELNEKAKIALDERRKAAFEERRRAEVEARRREVERERSQSQRPERTEKYRGVPRDKSFEAIRGGLYILWWVGNIGYTLLCFKWASMAADSYFSRDSAWIPLALLPL